MCSVHAICHKNNYDVSLSDFAYNAHIVKHKITATPKMNNPIKSYKDPYALRSLHY